LRIRNGLRRKRLNTISGLDLDVQAGEVVAVVGSSGSGKSLLALVSATASLPQNAAQRSERNRLVIHRTGGQHSELWIKKKWTWPASPLHKR